MCHGVDKAEEKGGQLQGQRTKRRDPKLPSGFFLPQVSYHGNACVGLAPSRAPRQGPRASRTPAFSFFSLHPSLGVRMAWRESSPLLLFQAATTTTTAGGAPTAFARYLQPALVPAAIPNEQPARPAGQQHPPTRPPCATHPHLQGGLGKDGGPVPAVVGPLQEQSSPSTTAGHGTGKSSSVPYRRVFLPCA